MTTRRKMLKMLGAAGASAALLPAKAIGMMGGGVGGAPPGGGASSSGVAPFTLPLNAPPVLAPTAADSAADYYDLAVAETDVEIIPGKLTRIIGVNGATPGPTIRARTGRPAVVRFKNGLPATTLGNSPGDLTIHLHGGHTPAVDDGYPVDPTFVRGGTRTYNYPNNQPAATLWYHDHLKEESAPHVWYGLAGFYLISDDLEASLGLPSGAYDIPLVVQDRAFDASGQIVYTENVNGETGDTLLVNGTIQPYFRVAARKYRFRILNGSNMRPYEIALSNGQSFQVLGMEGGLLSAPVTASSIALQPAERADVVIDFTTLVVGTSVVLQNLSGAGSTADIMRFDVDRIEADPSVVPAILRPIEKLDPASAVATRSFTFSRRFGADPWVINGRIFEENRVDAFPRLDTTEIWTLTNRSMMTHPVHIHDVFFQILDVNGAPPPATHAGWKDTVPVPPMGTARVILRFNDYLGRYVFHCHVLEHEDHMMMAQFEVIP